jgi:AcrR family transcriptional regulator
MTMAKKKTTAGGETKDQKSKDEIFWAIFDSIIKLDITKGHMGWSISDVSRVSGISRPLIYYYFGKSKENIMQTAVDYLGKEYFGLSEDRMELWKQRNIYESVSRSRKLWQKSPYSYSFYVMRRDLQNPVGETIRDLEKKYEEKLRSFYPSASRNMHDAVTAVLFGLAVSPTLTEDGLKNAVQIVEAYLSQASGLARGSR